MSIIERDLGSVWHSLSLINKSFVLFFSGVSLYTFSLSVYAQLALRNVKNRPASETRGCEQSSIGLLFHRFASLRQLHLFTLYLFGFCIAMQIPSAFHTLLDSKTIRLTKSLAH